MSQEYSEFKTLIKNKLGIDLTLYKESQMKRRLISLRNKRGFTCFQDYFNAMEKEELLLKEFLQRITINVSEFYRNPKRWEVLRTSVIPKLMENKKGLTIWSAACSTGEEPYSLALLLTKHFPKLDYQILATDIDADVLEKAKLGIYPEQALKELPKPMIQKYFSKKNQLYLLDYNIKKHVQFKKHNLLSDPYPRDVDLIVCRNVLIYFTEQAKEAVYQKFSRSLKDNGVLFVGSTEQIFSPGNYNFSLLETFFYKKNY